MEVNVDIFSVNENNLYISQASLKKYLQDINQQCNKYGQTVMEFCSEEFLRSYKPGGIMMDQQDI